MSATDGEWFRFVQLDVPGRLGLDDGRYLVRATGSGEHEDETVLVVQTMGGRPAGRLPRRQRRARRAQPDDEPVEVPVTRITAIPAQTHSRSEAEAGLDQLRADPVAAEDAIVEGLREINRVVRAHRIANQDPYGHEIARLAPVATRVGFGTGGELADGSWTDALDVPSPERRRRRADALRPQERLTELLAGREPIDACETLLLRARADVDQDRRREAALQMVPGLEALLTELSDRAGPGQEEDLVALQDRREEIGEAARDALRGDLSPERADLVEETLGICERVLRRRQALRQSG